MPGEELLIVEADPAAPEAASLIAALDADLEARYPGLEIHGIDAAGFRNGGGVFLVGKLDGVPVACGAIRQLSSDVTELKRMFVAPGYRGRGFARAMLHALERIAAARGYRAIRLETGVHQPEAIALYQSAGYRSIPVYGQYISDPRSRCFEKALEMR
jgi:GNAT superfamily N-acetyltransferase